MSVLENMPSVIVFDVNETLSDMSPMKDRFEEIGAPAYLTQVWFSSLLRDGFAVAASAGNATFAVIGASILREVLRGVPLNMALEDAVRHVMGGMAQLNLHPDIARGISSLKRLGFRLVTLSNGAVQVAETLLTKAEIRVHFDALLSVEDAPAWKPARAAYDYAAHFCGVQPADMMLVAVHPWDIHGAGQAGLRTAWLNRNGAVYPSYLVAPDFTSDSLSELATQLGHA